MAPRGKRSTAAGPTRRAYRYFAASDYRRHRVVIERALQARLGDWQASGWAIVGRGARLRIAVVVPRVLPAPPCAVDAIEVRGRWLKPSVLGERGLDDALRSRDFEATARPGADFLAPGVPLAAGDERIGVAAVVVVGGAPQLLTCGHALGSSGAVHTIDQRIEVATVSTNLFRTADRLDAALCELTDDGRALLEAGADARSWCKSIHRPDAADHGRDARFWPTHSDDARAFVKPVLSFSSCIPPDQCGRIVLAQCTRDGDSGSSLQLDGGYYGIASERRGDLSLFTSVAAVAARLAAGGIVLKPWRS